MVMIQKWFDAIICKWFLLLFILRLTPHLVVVMLCCMWWIWANSDQIVYDVMRVWCINVCLKSVCFCAKGWCYPCYVLGLSWCEGVCDAEMWFSWCYVLWLYDAERGKWCVFGMLRPAMFGCNIIVIWSLWYCDGVMNQFLLDIILLWF